MEFTKQTATTTTISPGKSDEIIFDDALPGFGLRLRGSGFKSWICQYDKNGKTTRLTLGSAAVLNVDRARLLAKEYLAKVTLGQDPAADREQARIKAKRQFGAAVEKYLEARRSEWRPSTFSEVSRYLRVTFKPLHTTALSAVQKKDIANILLDKARDSSVAAAQARSAIMAFFGWCVEAGICDSNPAIGVVKPKRGTPRTRILVDVESEPKNYDELIKIWNVCGDDDFGRIVRLLILTGARRDEIGGMRWTEFNFNTHTWTLPSERSKNKRELTLSLPSLAWNIIETIEHRPFTDFLFGNGHGGFGFTHWATKAKLDARSGVSGWTIHDLRRTMATGMAELGIQPHHIEAVLNHVSGHKGGVAGIYNRATYRNEIKIALAIWADHIRALVEGGERRVIQFQA